MALAASSQLEPCGNEVFDHELLVRELAEARVLFLSERALAVVLHELGRNRVLSAHSEVLAGRVCERVEFAGWSNVLVLLEHRLVLHVVVHVCSY